MKKINNWSNINEFKIEKKLTRKDTNLVIFFEVATSNKTHINGLSLHELTSEILLNFPGEFEVIGSMLIGEIEQKTNGGFRKVDDFESYLTV